MALVLKNGARSASRAYLKWSVAAAMGLAITGVATARAETIRSMDYMTEPTANAAMQKAIDACAKQTGVAVDRQAVPYPDLIQKVLLAAASRTLPDIIYIDNSDVAKLADGGYILPISDVGLKTEGFVPALAALGDYKGVNYALPSANNTIGLYYNVDLLKKAGIEPPRTWSELKEAARKLSGGQTYGLAFPGTPNEMGTFHTSTFVWSDGGSFDKLNSPQAIGALEYLADLVKIGAVSKSVITWGIDESRDQFLAGRAAMLIGGSWLMPQLDKHPDLHYGIVPIPTPKADEQVKVPVGGELWVVSVTADKEAAKKTLECLSSPEVVLEYAEGRHNIPAVVSVMDRFNKDLPKMAPFVSEMAGAVSRTSVLGTAYPKYSAAYSAAMQAVLIGQKTAKEALDEAQQTASGK